MLTKELEEEYSFELEQVSESFESILNCQQCSRNAEQYLDTFEAIHLLPVTRTEKIKLFKNALFVQKFCQAPLLVRHKPNILNKLISELIK